MYKHIDTFHHIMLNQHYTGDFISFKLDIDHSDTEMPIASNI
jgi:hypothetical protein